MGWLLQYKDWFVYDDKCKNKKPSLSNCYYFLYYVSFLIAKNILVSFLFLALYERSEFRTKQVYALDEGDSNNKKINNSLYLHKSEAVIDMPCQ